MPPQNIVQQIVTAAQADNRAQPWKAAYQGTTEKNSTDVVAIDDSCDVLTNFFAA